MASKQHSLGQIIQRLRQQANLTQDELSDRAGLAYSTLAKIERGAIKNPSVFTVFSLAQALKVSVEELMNAEAPTPLGPVNIKPIKFMFFDMNGVLVRFFQRAFVKLSEEYGVPLDQIETTFWHYNDACNRGDMTVKQFNDAMSEHLGFKNFDWPTYYLDAVEPIEEVHACLSGLKGKVGLGMLTNTMPGFIDALRERQYIPDIEFDTVIDSSVVKAIKPEERIYEIAEKESGFKGSDIFFVDDSRTNLMAAERFGWRVLWFDDYRPEESVQRIESAVTP